jgi:hypothetical protein
LDRSDQKSLEESKKEFTRLLTKNSQNYRTLKAPKAEESPFPKLRQKIFQKKLEKEKFILESIVKNPNVFFTININPRTYGNNYIVPSFPSLNFEALRTRKDMENFSNKPKISALKVTHWRGGQNNWHEGKNNSKEEAKWREKWREENEWRYWEVRDGIDLWDRFDQIKNWRTKTNQLDWFKNETKQERNNRLNLINIIVNQTGSKIIWDPEKQGIKNWEERMIYSSFLNNLFLSNPYEKIVNRLILLLLNDLLISYLQELQDSLAKNRKSVLNSPVMRNLLTALIGFLNICSIVIFGLLLVTSANMVSFHMGRGYLFGW